MVFNIPQNSRFEFDIFFLVSGNGKLKCIHANIPVLYRPVVDYISVSSSYETQSKLDSFTGIQNHR